MSELENTASVIEIILKAMASPAWTIAYDYLLYSLEIFKSLGWFVHVEALLFNIPYLFYNLLSSRIVKRVHLVYSRALKKQIWL